MFSFNFEVFRGIASHNCLVSSENVSSAVAEISPTERARKCRISECAIRDGAGRRGGRDLGWTDECVSKFMRKTDENL